MLTDLSVLICHTRVIRVSIIAAGKKIVFLNIYRNIAILN